MARCGCGAGLCCCCCGERESRTPEELVRLPPRPALPQLLPDPPRDSCVLAEPLHPRSRPGPTRLWAAPEGWRAGSGAGAWAPHLRARCHHLRVLLLAQSLIRCSSRCYSPFPPAVLPGLVLPRQCRSPALSAVPTLARILCLGLASPRSSKGEWSWQRLCLTLALQSALCRIVVLCSPVPRCCEGNGMWV